MNKYETVFIISPTADSETIDKVIEGVQNLITGNGGEVKKIDQWGKRRLAYEVKGNRDGFYVIINFDGNPEFVSQLYRYYGLADDIIKSMTLRAEKLLERSSLSEDDNNEKKTRSYDDDDDDDDNNDENEDDDIDDDDEE